MFKLIGQRMRVLVGVDAGGRRLEQIAAMHEMSQTWPDIVEQVHEPLVCYRARER